MVINYYKRFFKWEHFRAEPMKPKKRIDPAILRAREEKKKRKVEKLIRKRLKLDRQLKPIEENEIPLCLAENLR